MPKVFSKQDGILFSVLIANYNNGKYIREAIKSVYKQNYHNWEIIVIDDASTDDSIEVIESFLSDHRIHFFCNDHNEGCGYTKKRCIDLASGEICGFLDPDDVLADNSITHMVANHQKHPEYSVINSTHYQCDASLRILQISPYPKQIPDDTSYLLLNDGSIHHFASFKRAAYFQTKGLNPFYKKAIDQHLYLLLDSVGLCGYIDEPLYYYRIHKGGISNFENVKPAFMQHLQIIKEMCRDRLKGNGRPLNRRKVRRVYHQAALKLAFLEKRWMSFFVHVVQYSFYGGGRDLVSVARRKIMGSISLVAS